ncbi:hypothetical protein, partial [Tannerella forsythia]
VLNPSYSKETGSNEATTTNHNTILMRHPWRLKDEQGHLLRYPYRFFEEKESFSCVCKNESVPLS